MTTRLGVPLSEEDSVYNKDREESHQPKVHMKRPRIESPQKLQQILNYNPSVDKVSELLGVDTPTVYEFYKEQAEEQIEKQKLFNKPRNKRNSQKALTLLGHDPSTEKVMQTLGIDEEILNDIYHQNLLAATRPRRAETSLNKSKYAKALATLGFNLSLYKATQLLGVDEDILRAVYDAERAAQDERRARRLARDRKALNDKKRNRKALNVIGFDPSLEKALSVLGVAEGTHEEAQVGSILRVENRQREIPHSGGSTALVYALSAAILLTSLRHK